MVMEVWESSYSAKFPGHPTNTRARILSAPPSKSQPTHNLHLVRKEPVRMGHPQRDPQSQSPADLVSSRDTGGRAKVSLCGCCAEHTLLRERHTHHGRTDRFDFFLIRMNGGFISSVHAFDMLCVCVLKINGAPRVSPLAMCGTAALT